MNLDYNKRAMIIFFDIRSLVIVALLFIATASLAQDSEHSLTQEEFTQMLLGKYLSWRMGW